MISLWLLSQAIAGAPVVALGDGLVVSPAEAAGPGPSAGSWVAVLADCLDERSPAKYRVVDRVHTGETARTALKKVETVRALEPSVVVVGLGARELGQAKPDAVKFRRDLTRLVRDLRVDDSTTEVLLVGMVSPVLDTDSAAHRQSSLDAQASAWNVSLAEIAAEAEGVQHVDLWANWPRSGADRAALTDQVWTLSDQGHARVATAICDALTGIRPEALPAD